MTAEIMDSTETFRIRAIEWHAPLAPADATRRWFADQVTRITLELDHSCQVERALRDRVALRAEVCWDGDRRIEVEVLARGLSERPSEVATKLQQTVQGCDWLIKRWLMLADTASHRGMWTADQNRLAFDLLGTPIEVRGGFPCIRLGDDGKRAVDLGPIEFVRSEVDRLRAIRDDLASVDDFNREMTAADLSDASTPELRRFRRHVASLHARLRWCLKQCEAARPASTPVPNPAPSRVEDEAGVEPPDEATPDLPEIETKADALTPRTSRKLDRAASRREAKLRKLERRRA